MAAQPAPDVAKRSKKAVGFPMDPWDEGNIYLYMNGWYLWYISRKINVLVSDRFAFFDVIAT